MPSTFVCDRFGVASSTEALYTEYIQSVMVELDGEADCLIHVALDAYALRNVSLLTFAPAGRDILPYRFELLMINQARRI